MWSSTVVRTAVTPDTAVPYAVAYVDVQDGPRVLAKSPSGAALPLGSAVRLVTGADGSLLAEGIPAA